mgnify:CR=1 FL=1
MTKTQRPAGASEPPREDIDDLIFLGQSGPQISQR